MIDNLEMWTWANAGDKKLEALVTSLQQMADDMRDDEGTEEPAPGGDSDGTGSNQMNMVQMELGPDEIQMELDQMSPAKQMADLNTCR